MAVHDADGMGTEIHPMARDEPSRLQCGWFILRLLGDLAGESVCGGCAMQITEEGDEESTEHDEERWMEWHSIWMANVCIDEHVNRFQNRLVEQLCLFEKRTA